MMFCYGSAEQSNENILISISFFIWLISIPFVCVCIFIHLFVNGHLGCFHVLAIINSATVNIGVHVSFWIGVFISSIYISRSGIAGSSSLVFQGISEVFSIVATPIYIPTNGVGGFPFLHILYSICYL